MVEDQNFLEDLHSALTRPGGSTIHELKTLFDRHAERLLTTSMGSLMLETPEEKGRRQALLLFTRRQ